MAIKKTTVFVGVDVGATTISGGLVRDDGSVIWATRVPTHGAGPGTGLDTLLSVVDTVITEAARWRLGVTAIGIGLAGAVDIDQGMMISDFNHLPELARVPIAQHLRSATGLPTFVDNDANALTLGEWHFGVGRGVSSMVLLAIGTDVGGGIILNDALVRGECGYAGELGHVTINFDGPECFCGGRGCLAMYLGGRQIAEEARRQVHSRASSGLLHRARGDASAITSELVFAAAADGDPLAAELVSQTCEALGAAVGGIVNALNPQLIVVTGGVVQSIAPLEKDILRRAARYAMARPLETARFCVIPGDKRYTVRGGAALALYELDRRKQRSNP